MGKITLKPLQEFRDANKNIPAPSIVGLWIEVSDMSISETQVSGAKYLQSFLHGGKAGGCLRATFSWASQYDIYFECSILLSQWAVKVLTEIRTIWDANNITFSNHTF